jgi:hypothetical protein
VTAASGSKEQIGRRHRPARWRAHRTSQSESSSLLTAGRRRAGSSHLASAGVLLPSALAGTHAVPLFATVVGGLPHGLEAEGVTLVRIAFEESDALDLLLERTLVFENVEAIA